MAGVLFCVLFHVPLPAFLILQKAQQNVSMSIASLSPTHVTPNSGLRECLEGTRYPGTGQQHPQTPAISQTELPQKVSPTADHRGRIPPQETSFS